MKLARWDDCAAQFVNPLNDDVIYNWGDFAGTMQWLNGACIQNGMNIGTCVFGSALSNPAYIMFVGLFLFSSQVKLNQISPLVSLTRPTLAFNLSLCY